MSKVKGRFYFRQTVNGNLVGGFPGKIQAIEADIQGIYPGIQAI
jgi:hypothetical protein